MAADNPDHPTIASHRSNRFARALLALGASLTSTALAVVGFASPAHADWVRNDQWQLSSLRAASAWHESTGSGVTVAVLDSGVDANHVDLRGQVLPGADFVDGTTDGRTDPVGHGTTVAALIAGRSDDSSGVEGVAPRAKILPVRVLDAQNKYSDAANVAKAVRWAVDHGADVVNMSLGGGLRSPALADAIDYAYRRNVVVVACTGNQLPGGTNDVWYPAREPGVVAVAGLAEDGDEPTLWSGTLTGPDTVLVAPAVNVLGARPGGYWRVEGTSFAAPLVSATAALIRSRWPNMNADNVINRLISTAIDLGPPGRDDKYGYGEVDPVAALTDQGIPTVTGNPLLPRPVGLDSPMEPAANAQGAGGPVPDHSPSPATRAAPSPVAPSPVAASPLAPTPVAAAAEPVDPLLPWWALGASAAAMLTTALLLHRRRP